MTENRIRAIFAEASAVHVATAERSARAILTAAEAMRDALARGDKIVVFKQKRRKNYAKKQGHRQKFTEVRIKDIAFGKKSGGEK